MAEDAGASQDRVSDDPSDTGSVGSADRPSDDEGPKKRKPGELTFPMRLQKFLAAHWRGVVCVLTPIIFIFVLPPFPPEKFQWCAYCLMVMAVYWVTECIPLQVTSFLPIVIFPLTDVMNTRVTCKCYINDTVLMFLGSIMLANAVEQSGLHTRVALRTIKIIGYSHYNVFLKSKSRHLEPFGGFIVTGKGYFIFFFASSLLRIAITCGSSTVLDPMWHKGTLFAVCFITMFMSMWITNTAATTMMVPILFAILKVYEYQGLMRLYERNPAGEMQATKLTSCYFCAITFSATIGGIGTLVGTATNLVFKGLFMKQYPAAEEYLSFPLFSAFSIPYMIVMNIVMYICMLFVFMGLGRPSSKEAKQVKMTPGGVAAAKRAVDNDLKNLGKITFHEVLVLILFILAMLLFFCRSPQIFPGWGDILADMMKIEDKKSIKDSAAAMFVVFLMILLPSTLAFFKNCTAKFQEQMPSKPLRSALDWHEMNNSLPYSFIFLLGGGFALSTAAKPEYSNLNGQIGEMLRSLSSLPNPVVLLLIIVFTVFITNFASNVAVCNVVAPIAMQLAKEINQNPLWYNIAAGFSASYCFMLPVGTPGNLIVQSAAKIPTTHMIIAGIGPTITTIIITWVCIFLYAPIIWPDLNTVPEWAS